MTWTDGRVATLKHLWKDGHSASIIAARLGDITRNAVIGKVHRLGLAARATTSCNRRPARPRSLLPSQTRVRKARSSPRAFQRGAPPKTPARRRPTMPPELGPAPASLITVETLSAVTCNWPLGDPKDSGFHFCGRGKPIRNAYCAHHAFIACA